MHEAPHGQVLGKPGRPVAGVGTTCQCLEGNTLQRRREIKPTSSKEFCPRSRSLCGERPDSKLPGMRWAPHECWCSQTESSRS